MKTLPPPLTLLGSKSPRTNVEHWKDCLGTPAAGLNVEERCRMCAASRQYLIVDGHSIIFGWPDLRRLHERRSALARDELVKRLRDYQDWSGTRVVVVFDGKGAEITAQADPHEIQIFYSRGGQTADSIIERLAGKYASRYRMTVATSDTLEQQTAAAFGADCISPETLRAWLKDARS